MEIAEWSTRTPTVLVTGSQTGEWVATALEGDALVSTTDDPIEATGRPDATVDCLVIGNEGPDPTGTIGAIRGDHPDLPIIFAPADPDPSTLTAATRTGATVALDRRDADAETLVATIEEQVARYDRHRQADRERKMFRSLLSSFPQSVYVKDRDAKMVAVSSSFDKDVDGDPIGKTDVDLFGPETGAENVRETYQDDRHVIDRGESIVGKEERHEREDAETLWLETSKFPWYDEGDVVGLIGETRDVTGDKRREHELEAEKQRMEQFASFASHDLRNPLTVTRGHLEHALETGDTDSLEAANDAIGRMERLIGDLLNIVQPDATGEDEWTDLPSVAERAWDAIDSEDATLTIDLSDDLRVRAASGALRQLVENLLCNAVEHAGPDVSITIGRTPTGFYVADDGPGIPADDREAVFEHGFTTGGTGVGLAVAAEIAEAHDWEPRVCESEAGGARFEFDRCLLRYVDRPRPSEGESVPLTTSTTIGDMDYVGESVELGECRWRLRGGGRAIWGNVEEYTAAFGTIEGDCRIVARLAELDDVEEYSKAGIIVVGAMKPGEPLGFVGATASHGHETAWRARPDEPVDTTPFGEGEVVPSWYRIDREGNRLTCFTSVDGEAWRPIDQHVLPLDASIAAGIAINSHEQGEPATAVFGDVRLVELIDEAAEK